MLSLKNYLFSDNDVVGGEIARRGVAPEQQR